MIGIAVFQSENNIKTTGPKGPHPTQQENTMKFIILTEQNEKMIQFFQDQIDDLDNQYWESPPSDPQKQIELLYKMIKSLNSMLYQYAVKEEDLNEQEPT
tara:strand:+ start:192 stop:491 length:300 start_codon:yes stop_codon:yes gene_type:complete